MRFIALRSTRRSELKAGRSHNRCRADEAPRFVHNDGHLVNIPVTRVDAATRLHALAREITLAAWNLGTFFNHRLHTLNSDFRLRIPPNVQRREATMLCCLWLDVALKTQHLFFIGMAESPNCNSCDNAETVEFKRKF